MAVQTGQIPLVDLRAQHQSLQDELEPAMAAVLRDTAFVLGPTVTRFEEGYAAFTGSRHVVGMANGTDAIELALRAVGIGTGDEVIVPAMTFIASATPIMRAGATPVLVDVLPDTILIDPDAVRSAVTERTRAVLAVHLYGQMAPVEALTALDGVALIEDAAQAQGASRNGVPAGGFGVATPTSFYPGKNLGAYGDAGAVLTNDDGVAARLRALRNHGGEVKYEHPLLGFNSRLDALQAAVLHVKLAHLADWNVARRAAAARYDQLLESIPDASPVRTLPGNEHVFHLYVVRVPERDRVLAELNAAGIGAGIHYPKPIHLHGAFADLGHGRGDFPASEQAADSILSLPLYPEITSDQQARVAEALHQALSR